jgi:DNA-binding transcriptional regulator YhcF (GntR family)
MKLITIEKSDDTPLTEQIIAGITKLINARALRNGSRMPSIRNFSVTHNVSRFTTVQAYDRLVASGLLHSRPGSGFYINSNTTHQKANKPIIELDSAMDILWLLRNALKQPSITPN